jgi:hypothetical protein
LVGLNRTVNSPWPLLGDVKEEALRVRLSFFGKPFRVGIHLSTVFKLLRDDWHEHIDERRV